MNEHEAVARAAALQRESTPGVRWIPRRSGGTDEWIVIGIRAPGLAAPIVAEARPGVAGPVRPDPAADIRLWPDMIWFGQVG